MGIEKKTLGVTKTHKLGKIAGKSYYVTLPIEFIRHLDWKDGQKVDITLKGKELVIKDWKK